MAHDPDLSVSQPRQLPVLKDDWTLPLPQRGRLLLGGPPVYPIVSNSRDYDVSSSLTRSWFFVFVFVQNMLPVHDIVTKSSWFTHPLTLMG